MKMPVFLTRDEEGADWFASEKQGEDVPGVIYPFFVNVQHPFQLRDEADGERLFNIIQDAGIEATFMPSGADEGWELQVPAIREIAGRDGGNPIDVVYVPQIVTALRQAGYDGFYTPYDPLERGYIDALVPFDIHQIVSVFAAPPRRRRNAINSDALEDALSTKAQDALGEMFKQRNRSRDLRHIREAMEVYARLVEPEAPKGSKAAAKRLRTATEAFFTNQTRENAGTLSEAAFDGLKVITGNPDPDWGELLENQVFASAKEAGDLIFSTLDPKTASFDVEEFNTAFGTVEFRRPRETVFPPPLEVVNYHQSLTNRGIEKGSPIPHPKQGPTIPIEEGQAKVEEWKAEAKRVGKEEDHSNEIVYSLFDTTGVWSQPWVDAGYVVRRYDIKQGQDLIDFGSWMDQVEDDIAEGYVIKGILGAPPCTSFANSGRQWWPTQHDIPDTSMVAKKYGLWATKYFDTPLDYANTLVAVMKLIVEQADPEFYAMENPVGRIDEENALPAAALFFDHSNFGDPQTKQTYIWGEFNPHLPTANVVATKGSFVHQLRGDVEEDKAARSETSEGFAYSFFVANNAPRRAVPTSAEAPQTLYFRSGIVSATTDFEGLEDANVPIGVTIKGLSPAVENMVVDYVARDNGKVFVDSGAFSGNVDFDATLDRYKNILEQINEDSLPNSRGRLYVVAPDVVGDQAATEVLQTKHAEQINDLLANGAYVIVPVQKGEGFRLADGINKVLETFQPADHVVIGIPFNKAAYSIDDLAAALKEVGNPAIRVHLFGIGDRNRNYKDVIDKIRAAAPQADISTDSNRMTAMFQAGRPATKKVQGRVETRAPERIDTDAASDTTEMFGDLYRGNAEAFAPAELDRLARAIGVPSGELRRWMRERNVDDNINAHGADQMVEAELYHIALDRARKAEGPKARREVIAEGEGGEGEGGIFSDIDKAWQEELAEEAARKAAKEGKKKPTAKAGQAPAKKAAPKKAAPKKLTPEEAEANAAMDKLIAEHKATKAGKPKLSQRETPKVSEDPADVLFLIKYVRLAAKAGETDFPTVARGFQERFGEGARALDWALESVWEDLKGETVSVETALQEAPPEPKVEEEEEVEDGENGPVAGGEEGESRPGRPGGRRPAGTSSGGGAVSRPEAGAASRPGAGARKPRPVSKPRGERGPEQDPSLAAPFTTSPTPTKSAPAAPRNASTATSRRSASSRRSKPRSDSPPPKSRRSSSSTSDGADCPASSSRGSTTPSTGARTRCGRARTTPSPTS